MDAVSRVLAADTMSTKDVLTMEGGMDMHRDSSKHGPRLDEAMKSETESITRSGRESRAEEWNEAEPAAEDQPAVSLIPGGRPAGGTPPGMDADDVAGRSELARWLQPSVYPADRERLLQSAVETQAPDAVTSLLAKLPSDVSYQNVQEVWRALGGGTEDVSHRT
jgi:hypothetical protein